MRILFIGDVVGRPGREILRQQLHHIQEEHQIDFTIANGENASGGKGINQRVFNEISNYGVDVVTMGNHVWDKKEVLNLIEQENRIIRPANYPPGAPGKGWNIYHVNKNHQIAVVNLSGRVYLSPLDCPFQAIDKILSQLSSITSTIIVDFHAEATSEKQAMGWYLDGRVSAVLGTHTHIQTADARILNRHTAYITDVGMTGPRDSVLGVDKELVIKKFITQMPVRFEIAGGDIQINAVIIDIDEAGRATGIKPIQSILESL